MHTASGCMLRHPPTRPTEVFGGSDAQHQIRYDPPQAPPRVRRGNARRGARPRLRPAGHGAGRPGRRTRPARQARSGLDGHDPRPTRQHRRREARRPVAAGGHRRSRRLQPPGERRLERPVEQRGALGLHQGDRGHLLHQPVLRTAVQRVLQRRDDPRRLPLRDPQRLERRHPGQLLRGPRRRLVARRQDPARRAGHRVQPLRRDVLRAEPGLDAQLDRGLREHLPGPHRPRRGHLLDHRLVEPVHRQLLGLRQHRPAVDRPLLLLAGHPAGRLGRLHHVAVHLHRLDRG